MSLVIAIKDKDRIILGADKQGSQGNRKDHSATKVWEVVGYESCAMGGVGYARANQIIQYCTGLLDKNAFNEKDGIDEEFVATVLAPVLQATLERYGVAVDGHDELSGVTIKCMSNDFIFAYKDRAFVIGRDLTVSEILDYAAIGSGAETARGSLYSSKDKNPFQRVVEAIEAAALETMYVDDSVEVVVTKEYPEDEKLYNEATGLADILDILGSESIEEVKADPIENSDTDVKNKETQKKSKKRKSKNDTEINEK